MMGFIDTLQLWQITIVVLLIFSTGAIVGHLLTRERVSDHKIAADLRAKERIAEFYLDHQEALAGTTAEQRDWLLEQLAASCLKDMIVAHNLDPHSLRPIKRKGKKVVSLDV